LRLIDRLGCGGLLALFCFSGGAQAGLLTDDADKEPWKEAEVAFPPAPKAADLLRFEVSATTPNAFFVDLATLSVGEDGVVRYVLVVRSPRGAENVTFEGIRCASGERRLYAIGQGDGTWVASRNGAWEHISFNTYNRPQAALAKDYFCDGTTSPVPDAEEARRRLKRGGARGLNPILDETGRL
jgi:CNP1-like family protein